MDKMRMDKMINSSTATNMINVFAFSHKGFIDICERELRENCAKIISSDCHCVEFEANPELIAKIVYKNQSLVKLLFGGVQSIIKRKEDFLKLIKKFRFNNWIGTKKTFRVTAMSESEIITSNELSSFIGGLVHDEINLKVDLDFPEISFCILLFGETAYFGVDIISFDISKREYKIFHSQNTIKGTLAYDLLRFGNYNGEEVLLDPCAGCGTIPIEAALFAMKKSPLFFKKEKIKLCRNLDLQEDAEIEIYKEHDKKILVNHPEIYCFDSLFPQVNASQKNAKIAGIGRSLTITKCSIDWLDVKFGAKKIDHIITQPPHFKDKNTEKKFYNELFYQTELVLNDKGKITLLCPNAGPLDYVRCLQKKFIVEEHRKVYSGKQELSAIRLRKN